MRFDLKPSSLPSGWGSAPPLPHLVELRRAGYAALPAVGKTPLVSGFDKLRHSPSIGTTAQWAAAHPSATAAMFLPRLSGRQGVIIIDVDDRRDLPLCQALFGSTPYVVHSSRGVHLGYAVRAVNEPLPFDKNILKRLGINADIKGGPGSDLVVAPGSLHASGLHTYTLEGGADLDVINEVPGFRFEVMEVLQALAKAGMKIVREADSGHSTGTSGTSFKQSSAYWPAGVADLPAHRGAVDNTTTAPPKGSDGVPPDGAHPVAAGGRTRWHLGVFRCGSRKLGLNDKLVSEVSYCDTLEELLDRATDLNADLSRMGYEPLSDRVVDLVARLVFRRHERQPFTQRLGASAGPTINTLDFRQFLHVLKHHGQDAAVLLVGLHGFHSVRHRGDVAFKLDTTEMSRAKTMPTLVKREALERAIAKLVHHGSVRQVAGTGRVGTQVVAARYILARPEFENIRTGEVVSARDNFDEARRWVSAMKYGGAEPPEPVLPAFYGRYLTDLDGAITDYCNRAKAKVRPSFTSKGQPTSPERTAPPPPTEPTEPTMTARELEAARKAADKRKTVEGMIGHPAIPVGLAAFLSARVEHWVRYPQALRGLHDEIEEAISLGASVEQVDGALDYGLFTASGKFEGRDASGKRTYGPRNLDGEKAGELLARMRRSMSLKLGRDPKRPVKLDRYRKDEEAAATAKLRRIHEGYDD